MNKEEFLALMRFPAAWTSLGMYPDALAAWQIGGYEPGHEHGAEHDRNGAFHWWLRELTSREQLENLLRLAAADPDPFVGNDVRKHISQSLLFDAAMRRLSDQLFPTAQS